MTWSINLAAKKDTENKQSPHNEVGSTKENKDISHKNYKMKLKLTGL